ncbi:ATP-binding protein [Dehalococcoidia bacterium]|nr:ATP-binding protein [Dehalococcoidia bacterium]
MSIDVFLQKAEECIAEAMKAEAQSELRKARDYYLQASRQLFNASSESQGRVKLIRVENAQKLLEKAKSITLKEKEAAAGRGEGAEFILQERPAVTFDDVAGLENVKEEIKNKIIYPFLYPEEAKRFGIGSGGGILLYGPPGTGKTYIAKAVANEVDAVFFSIKPSEIMSKWVGESEQNIAKLFSSARNQKRAVIFIDEVEALIPKRKDSGSTVMQRVVPQILAEMEGMESKNENLLFIGATNEPWSIDHAALRPGRFDETIYVPPPDSQARKKIFELNLQGKPLAEDIDFDNLAQMTEGHSGADIRQICLKASLIPFRENIQTGIARDVEMRDLVEVIHKTGPSIDQKMVEKYGRFKFS